MVVCHANHLAATARPVGHRDESQLGAACLCLVSSAKEIRLCFQTATCSPTINVCISFYCGKNFTHENNKIERDHII